MNLGVVIPCYRQERFLPRTIAALERALSGRPWHGWLVLAAPAEAAPLPALSVNWSVVSPKAARPLTPGAARNAGFARTSEPWVLFVDADVEVDEAWIKAMLSALDSAPATLAGVWGRLEEWFVDGGAERPGARDMYRIGDDAHPCDYLATLALYRADALRAVGGYEPRLNSEEDFELGLRLRRAGFTLEARPPRAARHWSAPRPSFSEIGRRWRTGLCFGQGQVLRLYAGRPGFAAHVRRQAHYFATLAMWLALPVALAVAGGTGARLWSLALLALFAVMAVRKRSARLALHSLLTWTVNAAGMVAGAVLGPRVEPAARSGGAA